MTRRHLVTLVACLLATNVLPAIDMGGEDRKIETESLKILGRWRDNQFVNAPIRMSAMTHRVNVRDGHLEAVSVKLGTKASREEVEAAIRDFTSPIDELELALTMMLALANDVGLYSEEIDPESHALLGNFLKG